MPSVYVTWKGRCPDRDCRDAICGRIDEIACLSDALLVQSSRRTYDDRPEGVVLAEEGLFPPECVARLEDGLVRVSHLHLGGTAFRLADPRNLYPGEDHVSFVFATLHEGPGASPIRPGADGVLVLAEDAEQCKLYRNPIIQTADLYLQTPSIHLRYFAEGWMDQLLAFLRHFHMPELSYWRYRDLPGSDRFADIDPADVAGRNRAWTEVRAALIEEVAKWIPMGLELGAMRQHLLRTGQLPLAWLTKPYKPLPIQLEIAEGIDRSETLELIRWMIFDRAAFEAAAREAVLRAAKGLNLHYVPLHFNGRTLALKSTFEPDDEVLRVETRFAPEGTGDHAIAADEVAEPAPRGDPQTED
jgi:hypothetical protein